MTQLFGTDGIRGGVGEWPLVPEFFLKLGQAAGKVLKTQPNASVVIGRDTRQSGVMLQNALSAGLLSCGINVIVLGVIPTTAVSWLVPQLNAEAGAVISASHNPVRENGIKFFNRCGQKLSECVEEEIEKLLLDERFQPVPDENRGRVVDGCSFHEIYTQDLLKEHPAGFLRDLVVVVDCANGAASNVAPDIFQRAGARVIAINASPTGFNINVNAGSEYVRRCPERLDEVIQQVQANFGLAFDGDADRVVLVDEEGTLIDGDHILGFLSRYLAEHDALLGGSVVTTTMRNNGLRHYVESAGLELYETPVGDKYVSDKLMQLWNENSELGKIGLGGEQAGHIILLDKDHITGDGIRAGLFVLRAFLESHYVTLAAFATGVGKTPQIIASAYVGNTVRFDKQHLETMQKELLRCHRWLLRANLRYSGTEPLFRVMLESDHTHTEEDLAQLAAEISERAQKLANQVGAEIDILNCTRGGLLAVPEETFIKD
jgi:phosphoglucosamine mutase